MSHNKPADDHRPRHRSTFALLAPVLAGALALTAITPTHAAVPDTGAGERSYPSGTYLVRLAEEPVASYTGGTDGLRATKPAQGKQLDIGTDSVRAYQEHLQKRREDVLSAVRGVEPLYTYDIVVNGFAADLTVAQANRLAHTSGVVSLTRNEMLQPASGTAAGAGADGHVAARAGSAGGSLPVPDTAAFMGMEGKKGLYSEISGGRREAGAGMILGDLDGGIDPGIPSVAALPEPRPDADVIAKKWKGECDPGEATAHQVRCNNKLIGARYFDEGVTEPRERDWKSPMDPDSHGTHTATAAAGNMDVEATVAGSSLSGRISGLAPAARIAVYKVCWTDGCPYVDVVAGLNQAVADGVDVVNLSIGGYGVLSGTLELAMLNAAKAGVFISAAGGNSGPDSVDHVEPWVTTVAASTHDTGYRTTLTLGDGTSRTGAGVVASAVPSAPLVDAARAAKSGVATSDAERCLPGTLDPAKARSAIVLCEHVYGDSRAGKTDEVARAGGVGMVLYNVASAVDTTFGFRQTVPTVYLTSAQAEAVKAYAVRSGSGATAKLGAARAVRQRAPEVVPFSSGGPGPVHGGVLKPDLTAPGLDIVAGTARDSEFAKSAQGLMSGTSSSAPQVAGLALVLRSLHPDWSPAEVKSALMTTATTTDNDGEPIRRSGAAATPFDYGAGHVVPTSAADPGLVYDSTSADWTAYICAVDGRLVDDSGNDTCAGSDRTEPSDLNYPTITVDDLIGRQTVTRTVTNVDDTTGHYTIRAKAPRGFTTEVTPKRLTVAPGGSATYRVTFTRTDAAYDTWSFGSVLLVDADALHTVRSTVVLRAVPIAAPVEAGGTGADGSVTLSPETGWNGTLTTRVNGLYAGTAKTGPLTGTDPDFDPAKAPAELPPTTVRTELTVPGSTRLARVGILPADHLDGSDVDMWVVDKDTGEIVWWPLDGNDEHVDLEPGTYVVYVNQYALPEGVTSQTYTLRTWLIDDTTRPDHQATAEPATQPVTGHDTPEVTVAWKGLQPAASTSYVGLVEYAEGTTKVGRTVLTVTLG
ncbi:S8 family serine peptidase [Streptomyces canus]|uniref:S8 family serine peptidase n=1 Tax=Streptomyces canus TaxID=58343 RepID=UPI0033D83068